LDGAGEDLLLGPDGVRLHDSRDLWRDWLESPSGQADRDAVPSNGPLALSYSTGEGSYRYDHLYGSPSVSVVEMSYDYNTEISDHALVAATIQIATPPPQ